MAGSSKWSINKVNNALQRLSFLINPKIGAVVQIVDLTDGQLIVQEAGMQALFEHKVTGSYSPNLRWVATIRVPKKNVDTVAMSKSYVQINTDVGEALTEWLLTEKFTIWSRAASPLTHRTRLTMPNFGSLTALQALHFAKINGQKQHRPNIFYFSSLLHNDPSKLYCMSCAQFVASTLHSCICSNSVVFGARPNFKVRFAFEWLYTELNQEGSLYSRLEVVKMGFFGSQKLDSAFVGSLETGRR